MTHRLLSIAVVTTAIFASMTAGAANVDVYGIVDTAITMDSGITKGGSVEKYVSEH